jgi:hypothetical protein
LGRARTELVLPAGLDRSLAGAWMHHAAAAWSQATLETAPFGNAVGAELVP